jgi:hypothetical protein
VLATGKRITGRIAPGAAICQPGRHVRGAAHPSNPAAVNWVAAHQVNPFFLFLFFPFLFIVLFLKPNIFQFLFMFSKKIKIFSLFILKMFDLNLFKIGERWRRGLWFQNLLF